LPCWVVVILETTLGRWWSSRSSGLLSWATPSRSSFCRRFFYSVCSRSCLCCSRSFWWWWEKLFLMMSLIVGERLQLTYNPCQEPIGTGSHLQLSCNSIM
jgi:hypothetical protein